MLQDPHKLHSTHFFLHSFIPHLPGDGTLRCHAARPTQTPLLPPCIHPSSIPLLKLMDQPPTPPITLIQETPFTCPFPPTLWPLELANQWSLPDNPEPVLSLMGRGPEGRAPFHHPIFGHDTNYSGYQTPALFSLSPLPPPLTPSLDLQLLDRRSLDSSSGQHDSREHLLVPSRLDLGYEHAVPGGSTSRLDTFSHGTY